MNLNTRNSLFTNAKIAEHAQRYDDMRKMMKKIVEKGFDLTNEERNLLSTAYKHVSGLKRQSWRIISNIEQTSEIQGDGKLQVIRHYREKIESDLEKICLEMIELLDNYLLRAADQDEIGLFYHKMKGDYYRYMCETVSVPDRRKKLQSLANASYSAALGMSENLEPANPIRLGLALNYAVFLHDMKSENKAILLAQAAFDKAISQVNSFHEASYKDSTTVLQLLHDNIKTWSNTVQEKNENPLDGVV